MFKPDKKLDKNVFPDYNLYMINTKTSTNTSVSKAKLFGRIVTSGSFFNLFTCICGATEWIEESESPVRNFQCKTCGESYEIIKKSTKTHQINHKTKPSAG